MSEGSEASDDGLRAAAGAATSRVMTEIERELETLQEDFALLEDPLEQLGYVRDLGRALPPLAQEDMTEATRLHGCSSAAWLVSEAGPNGRVRFRGTAEAILPRGVVALLLKLYSDRRPQDVLALSPQAAMDRLGISRMLSMNRISGLAAMAARINAAAAQAAGDGAERAGHPSP